MVDCNRRIGSVSGFAHGVSGKAQSTAIVPTIARLCNATMGCVRAAGAFDLTVTVHSHCTLGYFPDSDRSLSLMRRARTAAARFSSTATLSSQAMQPSVTLWP